MEMINCYGKIIINIKSFLWILIFANDSFNLVMQEFVTLLRTNFY